MEMTQSKWNNHSTSIITNILSQINKQHTEKVHILILTVIINRTKYFLPPFATDWLAISAALFMTGPKSVGPARETLSRALVYAIIIP